MARLVVLEPVVEQRLRHGIGLACGQAARVQPREVAACRQAVGVADGVATVRSGQVATFQRSQQAGQLALRGQQALQLLRALGQLQQRGRVDGLARGAVGHIVFGAHQAVLCWRRVRQRGAQVQNAGGLGVLQRHLQPARGARGQHRVVFDEEGFVDVFAQRLDQRLAQRLQNGLAPLLGRGHTAKHGQALGLRALRELVQVRVQDLQKAVEVGRDALGAPAQVAVQLVFYKLRHQLLFERASRGAFIHGFPFVHHLVHVGHARLEACRGEHGGAVAHQHGTAPALGREGLAQVVHDVGVDHGQVAQGQQRIVVHIQRTRLAARPFLRAVGAKVDERVGLQLRPQVHREVVVRQRRLAFVHEGVLAQAQGFLSRGLWEHGQIADLQARDGEHLFALPFDHVAALCGCAPVRVHAFAHGLGQRVQVLLVARQWQRGGLAALQQRAHIGAGVVGGQQRLEPVDPALLGHLLRAVACLRQPARDLFQAARHVEERGAEVGSARRVVVDHGHQALVGGGLRLQRNQPPRLGGHGLSLPLDETKVLALGTVRGHQHRVDGAGRLRLRQVERHIGQREARVAGLPRCRIACAVGLCAQQRHAPARQQRLQCCGLGHQLVQHQGGRMQAAGAGTTDRGHFQHFGQRQRRDLLTKGGIGEQALLPEGAQPGIEPLGAAIDKVVAVHQHGHGGQAAQRGLALAPSLQRGSMGQQAGRVGVVDAPGGQDVGRGQAGQGHTRHRGVRQGDGVLEIAWAACL